MTETPQANSKFIIKNLKLIFGLGLFFLAAWSPLYAQDDAPAAKPAAHWFFLDLGAKYVGWDTNSALGYPDNGMEILAPLTFSATPWKDFRFYGQTEYAVGHYTDSVSGSPETFNLSHLTDSVLGLEANFNSFSLPSLVNIGFNIPTGDPTWELKQTSSIVPTEFIDGDYRGRGFGMSFLYGLSLPAGGAQYGVAAGYMYSGAFNPYFGQGTTANQLKLGDSAFLSLNRAATHGGDQNDIIRVSVFYFLSTQQDSAPLLQMGPNVNASYSWNNPKALSFEVGGQYFLPEQKSNNGQQLSPEAFNSLGARFYLNPSYAFGNLTVAARLKYVLANGYPQSDSVNYDGGGYLAGLEPTYLFKLDANSSLKISAGYDYVLWKNVAKDQLNPSDRVNFEYGRWTFGTHYEVGL